MHRITTFLLIVVIAVLASCSQKYQKATDIQNDKIVVYFYVLKANEAGIFDYGDMKENPELAKQYRDPFNVNIFQVNGKDEESEKRSLINYHPFFFIPNRQQYCYFVCDRQKYGYSLKFRYDDDTKNEKYNMDYILDLTSESEKQIYLKVEKAYVVYNGDKGAQVKKEYQVTRVKPEIAETEIKDCKLKTGGTCWFVN